ISNICPDVEHNISRMNDLAKDGSLSAFEIRLAGSGEEQRLFQQVEAGYVDVDRTSAFDSDRYRLLLSREQLGDAPSASYGVKIVPQPEFQKRVPGDH